ncbi:hypothetical protein AcV7_005841 [Taiwanofungus camphoratus]|nr:hypothetical protein AcV7_005841 [Antrodia cinnamomea]
MLLQWHPVLYNDDILREIFQYLSPNDDETRRSLAWSARVCQAFSLAALDVLWRDMKGLLPLLKIMSPTFAKVQQNGNSSKTYMFRRYISDREWSRFQCYAKRIHVLGPLNAHADGIDASVFSHLVYRAQGKPLFPSLNVLQWTQQLPFGTELLAFMSQSLLRVAIHAEYAGDERSLIERPKRDGHVLGMLLSTLCSSAPFLQALTLEASLHPSSLESMTYLKNLKNLSTLTLSGRNSITLSDLMRSCATLEELSKLDVTLGEVGDGDVPVRSGFPALEKLYVTGSMSSTGSLLRLVSSPHLFSFDLSNISFPSGDWQELNLCLAVLSSRFASTLRRVALDCSFQNPNGSSPLYLMEIIKPLLALREVEEMYVEFQGEMIMSMTNEHLREAARSWPKITELYLLYPRDSVSTLPSIYSLVEFARRCPRLQSLGLTCTVDTRSPLSFAPDSYPVLSHGLRGLFIGCPDSFVGDPMPLARFLDRIFPNLDIGDVFVALGEESEQVLAILNILQCTRREQMERVRSGLML